MLGLSLQQFTLLHVGISLIGIVAGFAFFISLARGSWSSRANATFLIFTILTSVTGFMFPPKPIGPPFIFGVISLVVLALALFALYGRGGQGWWRVAYLGLALFAQYLNTVVLVVQSFQKVGPLNAIAPTGAEPPVLASQAVLLMFTLYLGWKTVRRSRV